MKYIEQNDVKNDWLTTIEQMFPDKPGMPGEPFEVSDVTQNSCCLSWEKPRDLGGDDDVTYTVEKCDSKRDKWVSVASNIKGMFYSEFL